MSKNDECNVVDMDESHMNSLYFVNESLNPEREKKECETIEAIFISSCKKTKEETSPLDQFKNIQTL